MRASRASLLARAGSAAAVAVLAGGGVVATATAADAASHSHALKPTTLSIKNKGIAHVHHRNVATVVGVLRSHRKGIDGESVTLDSRAGKHRKWTMVTSATTALTNGVDGVATFSITAPTVTTQYKLVFATDTTNGYRKSHSNTITIKGAKKAKKG